MSTHLDERKSTQMAAWLLERTKNQRMKYLKLIKLLYIVDREALSRWGQPLTGDSYFSLPHGPIVSRIQDLITDDPEFSGSTYWCDYIRKDGFDVVLSSSPGTSRLSRAEIGLLKEIVDRFGSMSRWELRDLTHRFPEWRDPEGSSLRISYQEILSATGREAEAEELSREIETDNIVLEILGT